MGEQVTEELMGLAQPHAVFLHCLPRHPEEVDDKVRHMQLLPDTYLKSGRRGQ